MCIKVDIINVRKVRNARKGGYCMELAKVTSKGQITIPIEIRKYYENYFFIKEIYRSKDAVEKS